MDKLPSFLQKPAGGGDAAVDGEALAQIKEIAFVASRPVAKCKFIIPLLIVLCYIILTCCTLVCSFALLLATFFLLDFFGSGFSADYFLIFLICSLIICATYSLNKAAEALVRLYKNYTYAMTWKSSKVLIEANERVSLLFKNVGIFLLALFFIYVFFAAFIPSIAPISYH